jgi:hypothetical protein
MTAGAQEFLHDPRVSNGDGVHAGDIDVHPGVAAEIGYDSNYLWRSDKTGANLINGAPTNGPIDSGVLRVTPSLSLSLTPASKGGEGTSRSAPFSISVGANGTYREFLNPALSNQRNISVNAFAGLAILPGHEWSGSISGNYARLVQPTVLGNPDLSYNNDMLSGTVDLAAHPRLGSVSVHLGYTIGATLFEQDSGSSYNNLLNMGYARGQWRFDSRASFLFDGQVAYHDFGDTAAGAGSAFELHNSLPVRARVGMEGLITPVLSAVGMVGYGGTFTQSNFVGDPTVEQYSSVIGNVELRFSPGGPPGTVPGKPSLLISTITLGYNRDFALSYQGDFYGIDRGYLKADYFFGGRFVVTLQGGVGTLEHPNIYFAPEGQLMANAHTDVAADATAFTEYRVIPTVGINATLTYSENFSDTLLPVAPNSTEVYDLNMRRITAFLGVRWFM